MVQNTVLVQAPAEMRLSLAQGTCAKADTGTARRGRDRERERERERERRLCVSCLLIDNLSLGLLDIQADRVQEDPPPPQSLRAETKIVVMLD